MYIILEYCEYSKRVNQARGRKRSVIKIRRNQVVNGKVIYTALLCQKEASDITSKSELLMFSYITQCALLTGQILYINTSSSC